MAGTDPQASASPPAFAALGVVGAWDKALAAQVAARVCAVCAEQGVEFLADPGLAAPMPGPAGLLPPPELAARLAGSNAGLLLGVGGDGSLLSLAQLAARHALPLLGVNLGRLGFLAEISADRLEDELRAVLRGEYEQLPRAMLQCQVEEGSGVQRQLALNEVIVHSGLPGRMVTFGLRCDGLPVYRLRGDGLILATPTGSTAYALSAGGTVAHPAVAAILAIPVLAHAASAGPLVLPEDSVLEVKTGEEAQTDYDRASLSVDGVHLGELSPSATLRISLAPQRVNMLTRGGDAYFSALRFKLGWGVSPRTDGQPPASAPGQGLPAARRHAP